MSKKDIHLIILILLITSKIHIFPFLFCKTTSRWPMNSKENARLLTIDGIAEAEKELLEETRKRMKDYSGTEREINESEIKEKGSSSLRLEMSIKKAEDKLNEEDSFFKLESILSNTFNQKKKIYKLTKTRVKQKQSFAYSTPFIEAEEVLKWFDDLATEEEDDEDDSEVKDIKQDNQTKRVTNEDENYLEEFAKQFDKENDWKEEDEMSDSEETNMLAFMMDEDYISTIEDKEETDESDE
jgi:hypothetical protein